MCSYTCKKEGYATAEALDLPIHMQQSITDAKKIPLVDLEFRARKPPMLL
jgi:hypothetical protein